MITNIYNLLVGQIIISNFQYSQATPFDQAIINGSTRKQFHLEFFLSFQNCCPNQFLLSNFLSCPLYAIKNLYSFFSLSKIILCWAKFLSIFLYPFHLNA